MVEDLNKMKANITIFDMKNKTVEGVTTRIFTTYTNPQDVIVGNKKETPKVKNVKATKIVKASSVSNTSSVENKEKKNMEENRPNPRPDGALIGIKSWSHTPPFL